jgi:hypothetical protein
MADDRRADVAAGGGHLIGARGELVEQLVDVGARFAGELERVELLTDAPRDRVAYRVPCDRLGRDRRVDVALRFSTGCSVRMASRSACRASRREANTS